MSKKHSTARRRNRGKARRRFAQLEVLESRRLLATYDWNAASDTLSISLSDGEDLRIQQSGGNTTFQVFNGTCAQVGPDMATESPASNPTFISIPSADLASSVALDNASVSSGQNEVSFQGTGSLNSATVSVDLSDTDAVSRVIFNSFDLNASSAISLHTTRDIFVGSGSDLVATGTGVIDLQANLQSIPTAESFAGVLVFGRIDGGTGGVNAMLTAQAPRSLLMAAQFWLKAPEAAIPRGLAITECMSRA